MSDLLERLERKAAFTAELLQPLVKATDPAIERDYYSADIRESGSLFNELVTVRYRNGHELKVGVDADSFLAMARDVLKFLG